MKKTTLRALAITSLTLGLGLSSTISHAQAAPDGEHDLISIKANSVAADGSVLSYTATGEDGSEHNCNSNATGSGFTCYTSDGSTSTMKIKIIAPPERKY